MTGRLARIGLMLDARFNAEHVPLFKSGWASSSRPDVRFFETERVLFRYREAAGPKGAPTIVFAADPPVPLEQYDDLLYLSSNDFRTVAFELPGMGFSPAKRPFRFGFQETNNEIATFLEAIAGDQSILAFPCGSGLAALDLANRRPELVAALALIQTTDVAGFARWKAARDPRRILAKPIVGQIVMRKLAKDRMPSWFHLALGRKEHEERFCNCSNMAMDEGALWSLASAYQSYLRPDIELSPVAQPTLAIWGEADGSHPIENRDAILSVAPKATIRSFPDLGHFPELQAPGVVFPIIRDWINHVGL